MKKWFMENGFEKNGTMYGKRLRMVEELKEGCLNQMKEY